MQDATIILQARMGSARRPGKVLAPLAGRLMLVHCIERLTRSRCGPVVVATTAQPEDAAIRAVCAALGVPALPGPTEDVLSRFGAVAAATGAHFVIRATADNPAVDVESPKRVLEALRGGADYAVEDGLPVGATVEGLTAAALMEAVRCSTDPYEREHVTPYVRRRPDRFRLAILTPPDALVDPELRFTVDTDDDLRRMSWLLERAGAREGVPSLADLIAAARRFELPSAEVA